MAITISEKIYRALADEIMSGKIKPGQKLEEQAIADRFEVSRTPVRDALRQLASTGLVYAEAHKGVTVVNIGVDQLTDMFDAMGELEALCAKLAAQRMTSIERKKLMLLHDMGKAAVADNDESKYASLNEHFHATIYNGAHNRSIKDLTLNFRLRLAPFRASVFFKIDGRMKSSLDEHDDITRAIVAADSARAYEAMRHHVASSNLNVIDYLVRARVVAGGEGAEDDYLPAIGNE